MSHNVHNNETPRDVVTRWARPLREGHPIQEQWERADEAGRHRIDDALIWMRYGVAGPSLSRYPSPDVAATLILTSAEPVELAPNLSRKEARLWSAQNVRRMPGEWLWSHICHRHGLPDTTRRPEWMSVIRWADQCLCSARRRDALLRRLTRLDEVEPCDLRDSVADTFAAADERRRLAHWSGEDRLIEPPPWAQKLPQGVRLLTTASGLLEEGRALRHCVGDYAERVHLGRAWILSITAPCSRSTVEISPSDMRVRQHYSVENSSPSAECQRLLSAALRVIGSD